MARVFSLSIHADYACAHSGACCTAGWAIPVEPAKQRELGAALLLTEDDGACRFYDRGSRLCVVHRNRGEAALPDACRHFPRVALHDGRGVHVSLSHFCPTAATQLFRTDLPLAIVESPRAFPPSRDYEGLDARNVWPPLVHRTLLFDLDGYAAWERFVVSALAEGDSGRALARVATAAERLRAWSPEDGAMTAAIAGLETSDAPDERALERYGPIRAGAPAIVATAIPTERRPPPPPRRSTDDVARPVDPPSTGEEDAVICRYLAAKAFASWTAYQGRGIRTLVAELVVADALVRQLAATRTLLEAIREADRCLVHLADRPALVEAIGCVENEAPHGGRVLLDPPNGHG